MTPSNTHPGTAARGLRRTFLQAASGLRAARDDRRPADRARARPRLEGLEDRCLLSITEFPIPTANAQPWDIETGPDGNLWFAEYYTSKLGRIDPTTHTVTEISIPTANAGPRGIAVGPDGNIWFTENAGKIGMINPATLTITEFATPAAGSHPYWITAGPDGNLWFTDNGADQVGMINPTTHAISVFPIPYANADPRGITVGPDGNLWFAELSPGRIGMINPTTHDISVFPVPDANSFPRDIVAGPDGNLWFAEGNAKKIGMINPTTHGIVEFATSGVSSQITAGPDGNIWFTEPTVGKLGMIDPATHIITELSLPYADSYPRGITTGPDGNLWFGDYATNAVGVLDLGFRIVPGAGLVTTEAGGTASFTVALASPPTADVTIPVSSGDLTEGTVSPSSLTFTPANWDVPQTVTVTGVDDALADGDAAYTIVLGVTSSADSAYDGRDPYDVAATNTDDEPPTKFYVVNDASTDRTYEYGPSGSAVENYALGGGNTAPRGAASTAAGDKVWVVDANKKVYVYDTVGALLGSWTAGGLAWNATVEGIAISGTDIYFVDARRDRVYRYAGAADRLSGSQTAISSFALNSGNRSPKDIVSGDGYLWVVNDATTDKVFKYYLYGTLLGSWTITGAGSSPTGITLDPSGGGHLWIVDSGTDRVYQFDNARDRTSGSQSPSTSFALAAGNTNPQGIADPPTGSSTAALTRSRNDPTEPSRPTTVNVRATRRVPHFVRTRDGVRTPFAGQIPTGPLALRSRFVTTLRRP